MSQRTVGREKPGSAAPCQLCCVSLRGIGLRPDGVPRLPHPPRDKVKRFKAYEIGYFHLDICELRTAEGKAYLFVAVDRTSKLVFARLYRKANKLAAQAFLKVLIRTVPYKIHTILTDNGV